MEYQKVPPIKTIFALALTLIPIDVVSFLYGFRPLYVHSSAASRYVWVDVYRYGT